MAEDFIRRSLDTQFDKLPPGSHRVRLKAKNPVMAKIFKFVASLTVYNVLGKKFDPWGDVVKEFNKADPKVKMQATNFFNGKFRPRKRWIESTKTFEFWIVVSK